MENNPNAFMWQVKELGKRLISQQESMTLIEKEAKAIEAKINTRFTIDISEIQARVDKMEADKKIIMGNMTAFEEEVRCLELKVRHLEKSVKTVKRYIRQFEKATKIINTKSMTVDGKIDSIKQKLATTDPKHPFAAHYKLTVTR